jgi:hypothetical protein
MSILNRMCPRYGNWGGPGWSGGTFPARPSDTDWSIPGIDSMDDLFKEHDRGYQDALSAYNSQDINKSEMIGFWDDADKNLVSGLGGLSRSPGRWSRPAPNTLWAWFYRNLGMGSFWIKRRAINPMLKEVL